MSESAETPQPSRRRAMPRRVGGAARVGHRLPVLVGLAGLLAVGGLIDRSGGHPGPAPVGASLPVPVAAPPQALSSSWFCGGATGTANGAAPAEAVVANTGASPLTARVRLVPSSGDGTTQTVTVPAHGTAAVPETLPSHPAWIGAVVDLDGGSAAISQHLTGALGQSATPCATAGSAQWYLPTGATLINASDTVTLLNPYPTDAVVDLTFTTDQGMEAPSDFQGVIVPAGGLVAVDVGSHLRRRQQIATTVRARTGRVVAWGTEIVTPPAAGEALVGAAPNPANPTSADPAAPAAGVDLTLGAPSAGTTWAWPDGVSGNGLDERYVIYNPAPQQADVSLSVALDQGQAEPFTLTVGPGQVTTVVSSGEARIPPGVGHTATLTSTNGVGVVAARSLQGVAPASRRGTGVLLGARVASSDWVVPVATGGGSDTLTLLPTGTNPLDVTIDGLANGRETPLPGLSGLTIAPGQRSVVDLATKAPGYRGALVVRATGTIYVESDLFAPAGATGISLSTGVPLS